MKLNYTKEMEHLDDLAIFNCNSEETGNIDNLYALYYIQLGIISEAEKQGFLTDDTKAEVVIEQRYDEYHTPYEVVTNRVYVEENKDGKIVRTWEHEEHSCRALIHQLNQCANLIGFTDTEMEEKIEKFRQYTLESAFVRNSSIRRAVFIDYIENCASEFKYNNIYSEADFFVELNYDELFDIKQLFKKFLKNRDRTEILNTDRKILYERFGSEYASDLNCIEGYLADAFMFHTFDYDINLEGMINASVSNKPVKIIYTEAMAEQDRLHETAEEDSEEMARLHRKIFAEAVKSGFRGYVDVNTSDYDGDIETLSEVHSDMESYRMNADVDADGVSAKCVDLIEILEKEINDLY